MGEYGGSTVLNVSHQPRVSPRRAEVFHCDFQRTKRLGACKATTIYINLEKDTIYITPSGDPSDEAQKDPAFLGLGINELMQEYPQYCQVIRMVAVPTIEYAVCAISEIFVQFTALKEVILVGPEAELDPKDKAPDSLSQSYSLEATLQHPVAADRVQRESEVAKFVRWLHIHHNDSPQRDTPLPEVKARDLIRH